MEHDKGYRDIFSNKDSFLHFLKKYIDKSWVEGISENDIEQVKATFIMKDYQKRESDVIYKLNSKNVYFYVLLELQSEPDFTMPFRLLQYMVNLLADEFKNTSEKERELKTFRLPAIVPIVLYNGETQWNPVMSFKEYTSNYGDFGDNIIDFKYILFDLNRYSQEDILTTHKLLDFVFTMDSNKDYNSVYKKIVDLRHELTEDDIQTFVSWLIHAKLKDKVDKNFEEKAVAAFRKGEVEVMTYAWDRVIEQERFESSVERAMLIARKMLKRDKPIEEIIEFTGLTREEIEKLR